MLFKKRGFRNKDTSVLVFSEVVYQEQILGALGWLSGLSI